MKRRVNTSNTKIMKTFNKTLYCALLTASVALSACGGGSDDGER